MGLSVLGVAVGVAVVVAIDLANSSAQRAFSLSTETVTGEATHHVVGATGPLPDSVYRDLRVEAGVRPSAPVVQGYASLERGDRTFQVIGIDPFADAAFRPYLGTGTDGSIDLGTFMTHDAALLSAPTAEALGLGVGDTLQVSVAGSRKTVLVSGLLDPGDDRTRRALDNLLVVDVSTAQRLFEMNAALSRIDLIVPSEDAKQAATLERVRSALPNGARVQRSESRTKTVEQMTQAFELNLTALSLLALVVGAFLIYNTMTFSVVQRRNLIGRLRALGVTQGEVFRLVLGEATVLGIAGSGLGIGLGVILASGLVQLISQTINDLYFVVQVSGLTVTPWIILKGGLLGLGTSVVAAIPPALEATNASVSTVLRRSTQEEDVRARGPQLAGVGGVLGLLAVGILFVTEQSIVASFAAVFFLLIGAALLTPMAVMVLARAARPVMEWTAGVLGRMAARGVVTSLSRTGVAIAALTVAVAATVGIGVMIDSFRGTVESWLTQSLQADVYVQVPSEVFRQTTTTLDSTVVARLRAVDGVASTHSIRRVSVGADVGPTSLLAVEPGPETEEVYQFKSGDPTAAWPAVRDNGAVLVSEPYAYRHDLAVGDSVRLQTNRGRQPFPIAGIYYDYASERGVVLMDRETYTQFYEDRGRSGLALYAADGQDVDALIADLRAAAEGLQDVLIRSNRALRETSLEVFDRTFTITMVLRLLALIVAFIGVLTALMALELERRREMGVLRATGMTPSQVGGYVTLQTGLIGTIAGLLSLPLGYVLAYVLVFVINKRSFGWTLQFNVPTDILLQALVLSIGAALVAGLYPAWKMARANPAAALREQ